MSWESGLLGNSGTMAAVLPDGERFSGKYTVVKKGTARGRIDPAWEGDGRPTPAATSTTACGARRVIGERS